MFLSQRKDVHLRLTGVSKLVTDVGCKNILSVQSKVWDKTCTCTKVLREGKYIRFAPAK